MISTAYGLPGNKKPPSTIGDPLFLKEVSGVDYEKLISHNKILSEMSPDDSETARQLLINSILARIIELSEKGINLKLDLAKISEISVERILNSMGVEDVNRLKESFSQSISNGMQTFDGIMSNLQDQMKQVALSAQSENNFDKVKDKINEIFYKDDQSEQNQKIKMSM